MKPILHVIINRAQIKSLAMTKQIYELKETMEKIFSDNFQLVYSPKGTIDIAAENCTVVNLELAAENVETIISKLEEIGSQMSKS